MRALAERSGPWMPLILIGLMVLAVLIGPVPAVPMSVASGLLLGPTAGFVYAMAGVLIGAAIGFWIAPIVRRSFIQRFFHHRFLRTFHIEHLDAIARLS